MIRPVLSALVLLCALALPARAVELRLVYIDQDASPYLSGTGTAIPAYPGLAVELAQRSASRLGVALKLTRMPPRRMIEEVKSGRQDGILGFRYSPERARDLIYPMRNGQPDAERYAARLAHSMYRRQGSGVTWDGRQVAGLAAPVAVSGTQLVAESLLAQGIEIIRVESSGQMFGMLALGRVDAVVIIDALGDRQMREQTPGRIEKLSPPVLIEDFHVPVSRRFYAAYRDFTKQFWQTIGDLREQTYAEVMPLYVASP